MNKVDKVKRVFELIENKQGSQAQQYLSDDFRLSGPTPEPVDAQEWLALHDNVMSVAFPDWAWNISDIHQHGENLHMTFQVTGTQTGDLDLSQVELPVIPASGKTIKLGQEEAMVEFDGDKICAVRVEPNPDAGLPGVLKQLGVGIPT